MSRALIRRAAGVSLAFMGVYMNIPFALLAARFNYPNILRQPSAEILTRFAEGSASLIAVWYAYALAAILLIPLTLLAGHALGPVTRRPALIRAAMVWGILSGVTQALGLLRWVFLTPYLAGVYTDPAASPAARDTAVVVFEAFHRYAGGAVGEHLGQLFIALWAGSLAASLTACRGYRIPGWLGPVGVLTAGALLAGLSEGLAAVFLFSPGVLQWITPLAYLALSFWMIALGIYLSRAAVTLNPQTKKVPEMNSSSRILMPLLFLAAVALTAPASHAQETVTSAAPTAEPQHRLYIHAFRSPSIGLEYRTRNTGLHAGLYTTILGSSGDSTEFFKTGITRYFSSGNGRREYFVSASYLRGLNRDYQDRNAFMIEPGALWKIGKRLEFRLGVGILAAEGRSTKVNPTIGVSWAVPLR